jgi:hypothetical protein
MEYLWDDIELLYVQTIKTDFTALDGEEDDG